MQSGMLNREKSTKGGKVVYKSIQISIIDIILLVTWITNLASYVFLNFLDKI